MMKVLILGLFVLGCNVDSSAFAESAEKLEDNVKYYSSDCTWRKGYSNFNPLHKDSCYRIYVMNGRVLSPFELANACDAPKLDSCLALHASETPYVYYDTEIKGPFEITYESTAMLADGSCPPCE